jgi:hypothetical protein
VFGLEVGDCANRLAVQYALVDDRGGTVAHSHCTHSSGGSLLLRRALQDLWAARRLPAWSPPPRERGT